MKLTLSLRDVRRRRVAKDAEGGGGREDAGATSAVAAAKEAEDGIGNSNTTAIKLNNDESGRSKYEHGYDLRPRKPRS